mmetsp:Transcript_86068/g.139596  ORF Transcript_86068/g.139596 Transcript_86068/m.139596 type:complete len:134 (-) Transcript_86068:731-1132(-)
MIEVAKISWGCYSQHVILNIDIFASTWTLNGAKKAQGASARRASLPRAQATPPRAQLWNSNSSRARGAVVCHSGSSAEISTHTHMHARKQHNETLICLFWERIFPHSSFHYLELVCQFALLVLHRHDFGLLLL